MIRRGVAVLGIVGALSVGYVLTSSGQESKPAATASAKDEDDLLKGRLPANWRKLELSQEQVQKIYEKQQEVKAKAETLEKEIDALRAQLKKKTDEEKTMGDALFVELYGLLTDEQKQRLKEIELRAIEEAAARQKARIEERVKAAGTPKKDN